jgi:hypothetical protein
VSCNDDSLQDQQRSHTTRSRASCHCAPHNHPFVWLACAHSFNLLFSSSHALFCLQKHAGAPTHDTVGAFQVIPFARLNTTPPCRVPPPPSVACLAGLDPLAASCGGGPGGWAADNNTAHEVCERCVYSHPPADSHCTMNELRAWCGVPGWSKYKTYGAWDIPGATLDGCFPGNVPGVYAGNSVCGDAFDPHGGALWEQRYIRHAHQIFLQH